MLLDAYSVGGACISVQEKPWRSLLIATYCLTVLGTFLTRSGVVNSVHAFTRSAIGPTLIAYLAVVALTGLALLAWRGDRLQAVGRIDSPLSREAAFLGNNLVLTALAAVVVTGTVYPLLAQALTGDQLSIGEPYFDRLGAPLGLALLFLMAVAPLLPYRAVEAETLRRRLRAPVMTGVVTMLVLVVLGVRGVEQVLAFGLAATAAWSIASVVVRAVAVEPLIGLCVLDDLLVGAGDLDRAGGGRVDAGRSLHLDRLHVFVPAVERLGVLPRGLRAPRQQSLDGTGPPGRQSLLFVRLC